MSKFITSKVLEFIKSDEKSNVEAILEAAYKRWNKNIAVATRNIETIKRKMEEELEEQKEYLAEAKEAYKEAFLMIEPSKKSKDSREDYIRNEYEPQIAAAMASVRLIESKITRITEEGAAVIRSQENTIALYKSYCKSITEKGKDASSTTNLDENK